MSRHEPMTRTQRRSVLISAVAVPLAGLPRIVTLHDFTISAKGNDANHLRMNIVAKTYRYKDGDA